MVRGKAQNLIILLALVISVIGYIYINIGLTTSSIEFYTPRTVTSETEKHGVPFILHEYWHSRRMPINMANVVNKLIKANPEFESYIYSEKEAIAFLQKHFGPDVLEAYMGFKPSGYRSDLFRYCALYIMGGVYIDTKMDFSVPLKDLIVDSQLVVLKTTNNWCGGKGVSNALLITPPKNQVMRMAIDEIIVAYKARSYKENELDITGPCLIGDILNRTNQAHLREKAHCECGESETAFIFSCGGREVARSYPEYRIDQARMQKEPRYKDLYLKGDVYW